VIDAGTCRGDTAQYGTGVAALDSWRLCPRCGADLTRGEGGVQCGVCGLEHYANPAPAVSALVLDDDGRLLLARRAVEPDIGLWDTLGGFLEEGEDAAAGLRRELREEAGVDIEVGAFVGTFPDRYGDAEDAPANLNIVFEVSIVGGTPAPHDDVSELRWFAPDEFPSEDELAFRWLAHCLRHWHENAR
jgi:8-oxo-dGTP diphosphatase